jgi:hypothetical protein
MITCVVDYVIDPKKIDAFERFARTWITLVSRHGGPASRLFPSLGRSERPRACPLQFSDLGGVRAIPQSLRCRPRVRLCGSHSRRKQLYSPIRAHVHATTARRRLRRRDLAGRRLCGEKKERFEKCLRDEEGEGYPATKVLVDTASANGSFDYG